VALLPGSRNQEIERNLPTLVRAATRIHEACPDTRFLCACFRTGQRHFVDAYLRRHPLAAVETHVGRTAEIIHLARTCIAVSGSVSLELLHRGRPSAIVYRIGRLDLWVCRRFMTSPYITLVNLLAERELFPEFLTDRCPAEAVAEKVVAWLQNPELHAEACADLAALRQRVAVPGACRRAAAYVLSQCRATAPIATGAAGFDRLPGRTPLAS
jgi:lipid-A-disaccharide synthase